MNHAQTDQRSPLDLRRTKTWLFASVLAFSIGGCSYLDPTPGPKPISTGGGGGGGGGEEIDASGEDLIAIGLELYTNNCLGCHGEGGDNGAVFDGRIAGFADIAPIVENGQGSMPAFSSLSDDEISAIQAYLDSI